MSKRKTITELMKIQCLLYHATLLCRECNCVIFPYERIEFDHIHALVAGGPHEYENLRLLHYACHKLKTRRDIKLNCKVKRIQKGGKKRKGRAMKSRGFDKNLSRKFDGRVTARKP